jgi:ABC-2 type transport system ATP-binding protein
MGAVVETPSIYLDMTAEDNLKQQYRILGMPSFDGISELLKLVGLENTGRKRAKNFSLGMRQRLGIAVALCGNPDFLVLDEPINGLDPQGIVEVRKTLERLKNEKGITIMISSHILDELSKLADSYGIIHEGRLLDEFTTEELTDRCGRYVTVRTDDNSRALEVLQTAGFTGSVIDDNKDIRVDDAIHQTIEMNSILVNAGIGVKELLIKNTSLEDYYLSVTGGKHNG